MVRACSGVAERSTSRLVLLSLLVCAAFACSLDTECGSSDDSAPGRCVAGVCQCGVGYAGNILIDPTSCSLSCSPGAVPDSVAFLREPNVTVGAVKGNLVVDISLLPYARQTPTWVALLNPVSGLSCGLMPGKLGAGVWTQELQGKCGSHYVLAAPFAASVSQACWEQLASSTESGPQYAVTFNQYRTQVEVIQQGLAPFGQNANRRGAEEAMAAMAVAGRDGGDANLTRAFRRDYTISVATQFRPSSAPFTLIAEPSVAPTAVNDSVSTRQNVAVTVKVLTNDVAGYQNVDGVQVAHALVSSSLSIMSGPAHGSVRIEEGSVVYTPASLYHGADSFRYQICDSVSLCDTATVAVTVVPDGPVAADDAAKCGYESQISIDVLSNDVAGVGGLVTLTIVAQPSNGTAVVTTEANNNKRIEYRAAAGFSGIVWLTYEVCDGSNPTVLCDRAKVQIDVDGTGPLAVNDVVTCEQNRASNVVVDVLANDVQGTKGLNASSVRIVRQPEHVTITGINATTGEVSFVPTARYYGSDVFSYQVCDVSVPPKCASANVTVSVKARGPTAVDDSVRTQYASGVTVAVLANDIAGAEPLQGSSVTIVSGPSSNNGASVTVNAADGSIEYKPATGFVGSDSFTYQVCDSSTPVPQCSSASVTIVVQPRTGAGIQYRLVEIDYDILGKAVAATVQTRTVAAAKVGNVKLDVANSTGLSAVLSGPALSVGCAASSPAGWCDQFHTIRFSDEPCLVSNAEMKLTVQFQCADGGAPNTCGYQNVKSALRLEQLFLSYDTCPRAVEYGINSAASFLRLHEDVPRAVPVSAPAVQGATLYGRCSVQPSNGATFEAVTLSSMRVMQQANGGGGNAIDLGDQLKAPFLVMLSALTSNSATSPQWDFDLVMEPSFFVATNTYYLEATLDLTFANTGPLTRTLRLPLIAPSAAAKKSTMLRSGLSNVNVVQLVAISDRAPTTNAEQQGIFSNNFSLRSAEKTAETTSAAGSSGSGGNTAMIAGIAGGVAGLVVVAALIAVAVVLKRRKQKTAAAMDSPLAVGAMSDLD